MNSERIQPAQKQTQPKRFAIYKPIAEARLEGYRRGEQAGIRQGVLMGVLVGVAAVVVVGMLTGKVVF